MCCNVLRTIHWGHDISTFAVCCSVLHCMLHCIALYVAMCCALFLGDISAFPVFLVLCVVWTIFHFFVWDSAIFLGKISAFPVYLLRYVVCVLLAMCGIDYLSFFLCGTVQYSWGPSVRFPYIFHCYRFAPEWLSRKFFFGLPIPHIKHSTKFKLYCLSCLKSSIYIHIHIYIYIYVYIYMYFPFAVRVQLTKKK